MVRHLYRVFGSGACHGPYAQFSKQSAIANKGRSIGLLRGAGNRMASFFYSMHRALRLQQPLRATIHAAPWGTLSLTAMERKAVRDIDDKSKWKAMYTLLRSVFPALRVLRLADSNRPGMDKVKYLVHRTTTAIKASVNGLNNEAIFPSPTNDDDNDVSLTESDYDTTDDEDESDDDDTITDDDGSDDESTVGDIDNETLCGMILESWDKRKKPIQSNFATTAWALSVHPPVAADV